MRNENSAAITGITLATHPLTDFKHGSADFENLSFLKDNQCEEIRLGVRRENL